ncbi:CU044_2847 family protein [Actinosynnema sp. NPDC050801]|uniref:CU044_2847 family protein n=1 Tax=unclassified Actinosynnema TaxID=2637065 RepID=UPI0033CE67F2
MPELISFSLPDDDVVLVEVESDGPEISPVSRGGDVIRSAATSLDGALRHVRKAASAALANFRDMDVRPDEVQVEFGVKLNAQAGAVIAKTGVEGHLKIKLTWTRELEPRREEEAGAEAGAASGAGTGPGAEAGAGLGLGAAGGAEAADA